MPSVFRKWMLGAASATLLAGLIQPSSAQTTVVTSGDDSDDDNITVLSPFEVRSDRDVGYTATSTLAGSRMNSDLRDTPSAISVMTRQFLDDIAAISVNDIVEHGLNMTEDFDATGNGATENNFNFRVRGIGGAQRARNYFRSQLNSDLYNAERIDLARGPNSILFGEASPAGLINTSTKFARIGQTSGSAQLRLASYGQKRVSLDLNQSFSDTAAIRVNLLKQDGDGYRDFEFQNKTGIAVAGAWRPFRNTQIRAEFESIDISENRSRPWSAWDAYTAWTNAGSPLVGTSTAWGQRMANVNNRLGNNTVMYFQNGPWEGTALFPGNANNNNTENFRVSFGSRNILNTPANVTDFARHPRDGNLVGPSARSDSDGTLGSVYFEQTIGEDFTVELALGYENENRTWLNPIGFSGISVFYDVNAYLPQFDASGNQTAIVANPNAGKQMIASNSSRADYDWERLQYRATASYNLDFRKLLNADSRLANILGHHRMAALYSSEDLTLNRQDFREVNVSADRLNTDYFNTANRITRVSYVDMFSQDIVDRGLGDFSANPINNVPIFGTSFSKSQVTGKNATADWVRNNWRLNTNELETMLFASHSFFWNDRIVVLFGVRRDETSVFSSDRTLEAGTNLATGFTPRTTPDAEASGTTRTHGIVFHATPWLSLFYNEADNFAVQGSVEAFNEVDKNAIIGNRIGDGKDAGVKLSLWDGKVNASIAWYQTADANQSAFINGIYTSYVNRIWESLAIAKPGEFSTTTEVEGRDTRSLQSEGIEFELTANPTRQLRISLNLKDADTTNSDLMPYVQSYLDSQRAVWASNGSVPLTASTSGALTVSELVTLIDETLANDLGAEGYAPVRDRKFTANLSANYTFDQGVFKGLGIGSSVQYRGDAVIGYRVVTDGAAVYSPAYTTANAWVSYSRKLTDKVRMRLQLNVNNLFNFDEAQPVASAEPTVLDSRTPPLTDGLAYVFYLPTPRTYSVSATFSF